MVQTFFHLQLQVSIDKYLTLIIKKNFKDTIPISVEIFSINIEMVETFCMYNLITPWV